MRQLRLAGKKDAGGRVSRSGSAKGKAALLVYSVDPARRIAGYCKKRAESHRPAPCGPRNQGVSTLNVAAPAAWLLSPTRTKVTSSVALGGTFTGPTAR